MYVRVYSNRFATEEVMRALFQIAIHSRYTSSKLDTAWGPPRAKVGGGRESWTERQIGMLLSYFVIKLSVIKCFFNYDNAIIIIYKMQVKFINQSKMF